MQAIIKLIGMTVSDAELKTILQNAIQNLLWISESDAPFEVVMWNQSIDHLGDHTLLQLIDRPETTPVETVAIDQFFAPAIQIQDWQSEEDTAIVHQYQQLVDVLKQHLQNLRVYRVGEVELEIYILGTTQSGHTAGLVTKAVET